MPEFDAQLRQVARLREFQELNYLPVTEDRAAAPEAALESLRDAIKKAPKEYRDYLDEAVACYEGGQYRAAVMMVWAATVAHLFLTIRTHRQGVKAIEAANLARFGTATNYRAIKKVDDCRYMKESAFLLVCEDAGVYSKNGRTLLDERLTLRNQCGHPTGRKVGREEAVVFIESLLLNILDGGMLNW